MKGGDLLTCKPCRGALVEAEGGEHHGDTHGGDICGGRGGPDVKAHFRDQVGFEAGGEKIVGRGQMGRRTAAVNQGMILGGVADTGVEQGELEELADGHDRGSGLQEQAMDRPGVEGSLRGSVALVLERGGKSEGLGEVFLVHAIEPISSTSGTTTDRPARRARMAAAGRLCVNRDMGETSQFQPFAANSGQSPCVTHWWVRGRSGPDGVKWSKTEFVVERIVVQPEAGRVPAHGADSRTDDFMRVWCFLDLQERWRARCPGYRSH